MTPPTAAPLHTVVFADLDTDRWGLAWGSPGGALAISGLRPSSPTTRTEISFDADAVNDVWHLEAETGALDISPLSDAVCTPAIDGLHQLCEVQGLLTGPAQPLRAVGIRTVRAGIDPAALDSLRDACVWFAPDDGMALTALRPSRAGGQERDLVVASVFEPAAATAVTDPRLSTTYAADGTPTRAGLELWIEGDEGTEYSRRAVGESTGAQISLNAEGFSLSAHAMRWHSRGRDGIGAYVLARPG